MEEIEPCPFCKGRDRDVIKIENLYQVQCKYCLASGPKGRYQEAIDSWNYHYRLYKVVSTFRNRLEELRETLEWSSDYL